MRGQGEVLWSLDRGQDFLGAQMRAKNMDCQPSVIKTDAPSLQEMTTPLVLQQLSPYQVDKIGFTNLRLCLKLDGESHLTQLLLKKNLYHVYSFHAAPFMHSMKLILELTERGIDGRIEKTLSNRYVLTVGYINDLELGSNFCWASSKSNIKVLTI